ncbi:partial asparagine synthase (glutamine-hydrolysing), partial [Anaerolineae bacterium]
HYLLVRDDCVQIIQYWDVGKNAQAEDWALSENEYAERILELLDDSVRRRMVADVPIGAFLSGGVDSSAVVALMKQHATAPVKTFSLGFRIGGAYDELDDARRVANSFGTEHYELEVGHIDLVETLRTLVYHYDEPFGDAACFPLYLLSKFARQHVKVALSGDGGDELFGGYRRYVVDQFSPFYQKLPQFLAWGVVPKTLNQLPRLRRLKRISQTLPITDPSLRYAAWLVLFSPDMQAALLDPEIYHSVMGHNPAGIYPQYYSNLNGSSAADHLNRLMYIDLKTWLVDGYMEKTDKATMACSLEARLPLLDYRLVELAFQIPSRYKIQGWSTKRIFKKAVSRLLPSPVLRKAKHGFSVPTDPWFQGDLKSFVFDVLLDQRARNRGYFNMSFVEHLWREHIEGRHVWDTQLWLLLNFELWHRIYLNGETV